MTQITRIRTRATIEHALGFNPREPCLAIGPDFGANVPTRYLTGLRLAGAVSRRFWVFVRTSYGRRQRQGRERCGLCCGRVRGSRCRARVRGSRCRGGVRECQGRGWYWLIHVRVHLRIRPRHDVADERERQVYGTEQHERQLWIVLGLRMRVRADAQFSVRGALDTQHILSDTAERGSPPLLGASRERVFDCSAPRDRQT